MNQNLKSTLTKLKLNKKIYDLQNLVIKKLINHYLQMNNYIMY